MQLMERRGYGEEYINRYRMMTRFVVFPLPLVIVLFLLSCLYCSIYLEELLGQLSILKRGKRTEMNYLN